MSKFIHAFIFRKIKYFALIGLSFSLFVSTGFADTALDPKLIIELKEGHLRSCTQTIMEQLRSIGYGENQATAEDFCKCTGIMYFNDFTKADFDEMKRNTAGRLPKRVEVNRKAIQEYCADIHLNGL